jgi:hypothetical protein
MREHPGSYNRLGRKADCFTALLSLQMHGLSDGRFVIARLFCTLAVREWTSPPCLAGEWVSKILFSLQFTLHIRVQTSAMRHYHVCGICLRFWALRRQ